MKLRDAKLVGAFLAHADRRNADMRGADLSFAILDGADLRGADLTGAKLVCTSLNETRLEGVKGLDATNLEVACFERGREPSVDEAQADYKAALQRAAFDGDPISAVGDEAFAGLQRLQAQAGTKLAFEYRGRALTWPAGVDEAEAEEGPSRRAFVRLQARIRAATRTALHKLAAAASSSVVERFEGDDKDVVILRSGDKERRLDPLQDFGYVEFAASGARPEPILRAWRAPEVLDLRTRVLLRSYRVALVADAERYSKLRRELERRGHEVVGDLAGNVDAVVVLAPRSAIDIERVRALMAQGVELFLTLPHDSDAAIAAPWRDLAASMGLRFEAKPLRSGSRDPMSGETTFGARTDRIDVLGEGFGTATSVTKSRRVGEAIVELDAASALIADKPELLVLLASPPFAWLGAPEDKPQDATALRSYPVACLVPAGADSKATCIVLAARAFEDKGIHVGNTNLELGVDLIEWLMTR